MQGKAWVSLYRRIPEALHNCLTVMTSTGAEIVLQRLIRLDADFLVALGRLSGTTDQARVIIVPYDQMIYLSFGKRLSEEEIQDALCKPATAAEMKVAADETPTEAEVAATEAEAAVEDVVQFRQEPTAPAPVEPAPAPTPTIAVVTGPKGPMISPPSKTLLLARLRERLANEITRQAGT